MGELSKFLVSVDDLWTTPQVAEFLAISRQAINKRIHNRKMLGYPGGGTTLFPVWQFDLEKHRVRPEALEFLAQFDEDTAMLVIAQWSITRITGTDRTPAELLLSADSKDEALRMAGDWVVRTEENSSSVVGKTARRTGTEIAEWVPTQAGSTGAQQAILLAAADLFARRGPAKVTLREIASAAGVTYGLIHRFYRTKENLLVAVMELLVTYGGERLSGEEDAYAAIENSFGADVDAGQFGRMLTWSVFEGTRPDRLLGGVRSRGYRSQIDALWEDPVAPRVHAEFDSRVLASLIALVGAVWDLYEPYLTVLGDYPDRSREGVRKEVADMLKVLIYATRPNG